MDALKKEIDIISKLKHKNIVKFYGIQEISEIDISIILEYCSGGSISKLLSTYKKLSEKIVKKYIKQILEGLEYLHALNIIHRGIVLLIIMHYFNRY